jgi:predicted O-methyltransferase YrrM
MSDFTASILNARLPYLVEGEIEYLQGLAQKLPDKAKVLMIGAGPGLASMALMEGNSTLQIYAVDNNPATVDTYNKHLEADGFKSHVFIGDRLDPLFLKIFNIQKGTIHLLVIDADHRAKPVFEDISFYWPYVTKGGYVIFHDWIDQNLGWENGVEEGVNQYLDLIPNEYKKVDEIGISLVIQKK